MAVKGECFGVNKYDAAKEEVYNALWALCEYDDGAYQRVCSGATTDSIMNELLALAAKLNRMSEEVNA